MEIYKKKFKAIAYNNLFQKFSLRDLVEQQIFVKWRVFDCLYHFKFAEIIIYAYNRL